MRISIVGAGYVGLVTGVCFAAKGHQVWCVDVDAAKVEMIQGGVPPIHERGLDELLRKHIGVRLQATTDLRQAVLASDLTMIAVGTPCRDGVIDLDYVCGAARAIGGVLRDKRSYHTVVVKSTVVPGTTDGVILPLLEEASGRRAGIDFGVGMNPEFLTEGHAVSDFFDQDRIVLGGIDERSLAAQEELYEPFPGVDRLRTNTPTAEMIKYASNTLLATLISFSNELANLGAAIGGIDTVDVMRGVHLSRYLSPGLPDGSRITAPISSFLMAGCGFGGSCLPKDVAALIAHGERMGASMDLLRAVASINERQPRQILALLRQHFPSLAGRRVSVLGVAFRPDTRDIRESPAIPIVRDLQASGARVRVYDPAAGDEARALFGGRVPVCASLGEALADADAVVLVTRWDEFQEVPALVAVLDPPPLVVDGRRMLDKTAVPRYAGIGL